MPLAALIYFYGRRLRTPPVQEALARHGSAAARALGVSATLGAGIARPPPFISLLVRGRAVPVRVSAVLGPETAGALSNALAVIATLPAVQAIAQLPDRITGVLVQSKPGTQ